MVAIGPAVTTVLQSAIDKTNLSPEIIKAYYDQEKDRRIVVPLQSPCKADNTNLKGVDRVLKNMLNQIEEVKKFSNLVSATAGAVGETANYIQSLVNNAASEISGYVKNILGGVRGWIMNKVQEQAKKVLPFLFPGEIPSFSNLINKATNGLSCGFNKIVRTLLSTVGGLLTQLLDKYINAPLCIAQDFLGGLLDKVLGSITGVLNSVLGPIVSFVGGIAGAVSNLANSLFNALDFVSGILKFFQCDDDKACPVVDELSLSGPGTPGNDPQGKPPEGSGTPNSPSDRGVTPGSNEQVTASGQANSVGGDSTQSSQIENWGESGKLPGETNEQYKDRVFKEANFELI